MAQRSLVLLFLGLWLHAGTVRSSSELLPRWNFTEQPTIEIPATVRDQFTFPTSHPTLVASPFGPRWNGSHTEYHMGVDFLNSTEVGGAQVFAIGAGTVYGRYYTHQGQPWAGAGNVLVIQHTLVEPIVFHGAEVDVVYSLYCHLAEFDLNNTSVGRAVLRGQLLGTMGSTGEVETVRLHFEIRVGSMCSMFDYPESNCAVQYSEPRVNPLLFLPAMPSGRGTTPLSTFVASVVGDRTEPRVTILIPGRRSLALNRIQFADVDLDFDLYAGFRSADRAALNNFTFSWGQLLPGTFLPETETYNLTLAFLDRSRLPEMGTTFMFSDLWGNGVAAAFAAAPNETSPTPITGSPSSAPGTTAAPFPTWGPVSRIPGPNETSRTPTPASPSSAPETTAAPLPTWGPVGSRITVAPLPSRALLRFTGATIIFVGLLSSFVSLLPL